MPMIVQAATGLVFATVLGGLIGFQRQYTQKPAGIRTHALVSLGSCAFAEYSALLGDTRIAAGVITGIGFLGAGAIVRQGFATRGLTTAASIWTAAALGMGVGLGHASWALIIAALVVLTLIVLAVSDDTIMRVLPHRNRIAIKVNVDLDRITVAHLTEQIARACERVLFSEDLVLEHSPDGNRGEVGYILRIGANTDLAAALEKLMAIDGVLRVAIVDEPVTPTT